MRRALLVLLVTVTACGTMEGEEDAGLPPDAGAEELDASIDAGVEDAGPSEDLDAGDGDAGSLDAGSSDAGGPDAGGSDAGSADAGELVLCTANGIPGTCLDVASCTGTRQPTAGLCPGASNIQCCTPRYAVTCDPNAMQAPNVGLQPVAGTGGCALPGMIRVAGFCIDQYEASLVEVVDGGVRPWSPYVNPGTRVIAAISTAGAVPQGFITQVQAAVACQGAGKRLCTDAEWLRACKGSTGTTYPYGMTRLPGVCNDARAVHPAIELYGTGASWIYSHLDSPCLNQLDGGLDRTATRAGCRSEEGAYDMMGNLHEWTADPAGTFRGGFYVDTVLNGNGCNYVTTAHDVTYWDYSTGFRCCSDP